MERSAVNYYELEKLYGTSGAERICTLAEQFTNQVRMPMKRAIEWGIAQYEESQRQQALGGQTQGKD